MPRIANIFPTFTDEVTNLAVVDLAVGRAPAMAHYLADMASDLSHAKRRTLSALAVLEVPDHCRPWRWSGFAYRLTVMLV